MSGQDELRNQTFWGPGSFGGDNKGVVNNKVLVDPKTRATLEKLSKDAPVLADILKKALDDGFISPETVAVLQSVVWRINEDTIDALMTVGRNLDEDAVDALRTAGENINGEVANTLVAASVNIKKDMEKLQFLTNSLRDAIGQLSQERRINPGRRSGPAGAVPGAVEVMARSPRSAVKWRLKILLIGWSLGVGVLLGAILFSCHAGIWAWISVGLILVASAIIQSGKG
jgi:hypothetical protein